MAVESVQCPKCAAPVAVAATANATVCAFCGSTLRVTAGASGHRMAVLADIRDDTAVIAKRAEAAHLESRLQRIETKRQGIVEQIEWEVERRRKRLGGFLQVALYGVILAALGTFLRTSMPPIGGTFQLFGVLMVLPVFFFTGKSRTEKQLRESLRALDVEAADASAQVESAATELDRLVKNRR